MALTKVTGDGVGTLASATITSATISNQLTDANMSAGSVVQVVSFVYNSGQISNSTSTFADTGLTASITPSSSSNKILVIMQVSSCFTTTNTNAEIDVNLLRDSTQLIDTMGGRGTNSYTVAIALLEYNTGGTSGNKINLPVVINNFNGNTPIYDNSGTDTIDIATSTLVDARGFNYSGTNDVYLIINNCLSFLYKATIEDTSRTYSNGTDNDAFGEFSEITNNSIILNDNNIQPRS